MRKIAFRAWDGHEKKMSHTVNIHTENDGSTSWSADHVNQETDDTICSFSDTKGNFTHLMQYTGLKDKNGKEIYEDDIIHCEFGTVDYGNFVIKSKMQYSRESDIFGWETPYPGMGEIIGNIHENPELLTKVVSN